MKNIVINLVLLFVHLPVLRNFFLRALGFSISRQAKIGMCIIWGSKIVLGSNAYLKSFNIIVGANLTIDEFSSIGRFNRFIGDFDIVLNMNSHIGNFGAFHKGKVKSDFRRTDLTIGCGSNITSSHYFDLSDDIVIGKNSVIGGRSSQFWTHGFIHFNKGSIRVKKVKGICIGDGVYIGASSILNPGTTIFDDINIGAGSVLAGQVDVAGLYVNQKLRYIDIGNFTKFSENKVIKTDAEGKNLLFVNE